MYRSFVYLLFELCLQMMKAPFICPQITPRGAFRWVPQAVPSVPPASAPVDDRRCDGRDPGQRQRSDHQFSHRPFLPSSGAQQAAAPFAHAVDLIVFLLDQRGDPLLSLLPEPLIAEIGRDPAEKAGHR